MCPTTFWTMRCCRRWWTPTTNGSPPVSASRSAEYCTTTPKAPAFWAFRPSINFWPTTMSTPKKSTWSSAARLTLTTASRRPRLSYSTDAGWRMPMPTIFRLRVPDLSWPSRLPVPTYWPDLPKRLLWSAPRRCPVWQTIPTVPHAPCSAMRQAPYCSNPPTNP